MNSLRRWWFNGQSIGVRIVFLVLLANGLPAFIILIALPGMTEDLFVWTIKPIINARLIGVMYANALLLIGIGLFQTNWLRVRIIMLDIMIFSVLATVLTFFYLKPYLAHPWFHLAFWLSMYLVLVVAAPYVFFTQEKKHGGRLSAQVPLNRATQLLAGTLLLISLVCGLGLFFQVDAVNQVLPWTLSPLVGGLIGVLFTTHAAAYAWILWDGDWLRIRPMFWQAVPTGLLFILLPLLHPADLRPGTEAALALYYALAGSVVLSSLGIILSYRTRNRSSKL
jgi:hypothetical protein